MTIQKNLLIAGVELQDALVDKAGNPLVNGIVTFTQDTSRLTLKNVYYETGSPGSYTFVPLNNPLTLSAAGTIVDPSGNDAKIFFYPYDESSSAANPPVQKYYITVQDSSGNAQFDRQDFPYDLSVNAGSGGVITEPSLDNIVVNNEFWRNVGTVSGTPNALNGTVLAPSQHDGFRMPDIQYIASGASGTDTIAFTQFPFGTQTLTGDVTPEWYIDFTSTATASSRIIQIPLSLHLLTLGGVQNCTITLQGQSGSANNQVSVAILADYGTNGPTPAVTPVQTFTLPSSWGKQVSIPFTFPLSSGLISATGDDAFYLQLILPDGITNLQLAKPSVYLSADVPTNDFSSYDEIDAIINSPRTGDVRTSLNAFSPFGWVPCNDGSIAMTSGGTARSNVDTWQLYNLLWNNVNNTFAPVGGGRGASAFDDFTANKAMTLPLMLGRALLGLPPAITFTYANGTGIFTVGSNALFDVGSPVYLTNTGGAIPSGFALGTIYYAIPIAGSTTTLKVATTYANALAGSAFVPASDNGSGTNSLNWALGGSFGEKEHVQLGSEVGAHNHPIQLLGGGPAVKTVNAGTAIAASDVVTDVILNNTPANSPFNIVQPSVYLNVYFKL